MDYEELKMSQNFSICVRKSFAQNNPNNGTKQHFKVHYDNWLRFCIPAVFEDTVIAAF